MLPLWFNGKEKDDEWKGEGNSVDYGFRIYDPRLSKFLSVDPLTRGYPMLTPYQYASNNPVMLIDIDGLEGGLPPSLGNVFDTIKLKVTNFNETVGSSWGNAMKSLGSLFSQEEPVKQANLIPTNTVPPAEVNAEKIMKTPIKKHKVFIGDMISPVKDPYIKSEQSTSRKHPKSGAVKPHNGADIVTKTRETTNGTPVIAPADGKVYVKTKDDGNGAGNRVHMIDKKGNKHSFFHLQDGMNVKSGQNVKQGDTIGKIGTKGTSTGPHLHYEIRNKKGDVLNPREANPGLKNAPVR